MLSIYTLKESKKFNNLPLPNFKATFDQNKNEFRAEEKPRNLN